MVAAPVITATREAEAENCLNPGGRGGGCSEPSAPLHSSLLNTARLHLKKKKDTVKQGKGQKLVNIFIMVG